MAELVQGQAAVAQAGMKGEPFADALHRARQVPGEGTGPGHRGDFRLTPVYLLMQLPQSKLQPSPPSSTLYVSLCISRSPSPSGSKQARSRGGRGVTFTHRTNTSTHNSITNTDTH